MTAATYTLPTVCHISGRTVELVDGKYIYIGILIYRFTPKLLVSDGGGGGGGEE